MYAAVQVQYMKTTMIAFRSTSMLHDGGACFAQNLERAASAEFTSEFNAAAAWKARSRYCFHACLMSASMALSSSRTPDQWFGVCKNGIRRIFADLLKQQCFQFGQGSRQDATSLLFTQVKGINLFVVPRNSKLCLSKIRRWRDATNECIYTWQ